MKKLIWICRIINYLITHILSNNLGGYASNSIIALIMIESVIFNILKNKDRFVEELKIILVSTHLI